MIVAFGSYQHPANECAVTRKLTRELNKNQFALTIRRTWQINGVLHGTDANDVIQKKLALEAAYAQTDVDLTIYLDNGSTIHDRLQSDGSTSGIVIQGPDYPIGQGAEGGTYLSYQIMAEATYEFADSENDTSFLESFSETVTEMGLAGGPRKVIVETVDGPPVRQIVNQRTKCQYTQSGTAVGRYGYPPIPNPIWPDWETEGRQITHTAPQREGNRLTGWSVSWSYTFESLAPLAGQPNVWVF